MMRLKHYLLLLVSLTFSEAFSQTPVSEPVKMEMAMSGADGAVRKYRELKQTQPDKYDFSEVHLKDYALMLVHNKRLEDARKIFALNTESFPKSSEAFYFLGMIEYKQGNNESALKDLKKSLSLDPKNVFAKDLIQAIVNPKEYATYSYVCPPCPCLQHDFKLKGPATCIECKMKLMKQEEK